MEPTANNLLSLKWNNHRVTFLNVLLKLCLKECHSDTTIICHGKHFPAHKMVLASCSAYFEQIFSKTPNCKHPFIIVNELKPNILESLLKFMYEGEVNVPQDELSTLIKAAETLSIKGLAVPDDILEFDHRLIGEKEIETSKRKLPPLCKKKKGNFKINYSEENLHDESIGLNETLPRKISLGLRLNNIGSIDNTFHFQNFDKGLKVEDIREEPLDKKELLSPFAEEDISSVKCGYSDEPMIEKLKQETQETILEPYIPLQPNLPHFSDESLFKKNEVVDVDIKEEPLDKKELLNPFADEDISSVKCGYSNEPKIEKSYQETQKTILEPCIPLQSNLPHSSDESLFQRNEVPTERITSSSPFCEFRQNGSSGMKIFQCQFCPYKCLRKAHAVYHLRSHTGERPHVCKICCKRFSVDHNLRRHMVSAHGMTRKRKIDRFAAAFGNRTFDQQ